jgi:hypothetical protein
MVHPARGLLFGCMLLFSPWALRGQIAGDLVILSDRVGEYIDAGERDRFHLFQNINGFRSAQVVQTADARFIVVFEIEIPPAPPRVEYREYSSGILMIIAEKIDHLEGLLDGSYVMRTTPASLRTVAGTPVRIAATPGAPLSLSDGPLFRSGPASVRYGKPGAPPSPQRYPQFGFTAGIVNYAPDLAGLWDLVGVMESRYRDAGYAIDHKTDPGLTAMLQIYSATVVFSRSFSVSADVIRHAGYLDLKGVGVSLRYSSAEADFGGIRAYGSAGIQMSSFAISKQLEYGNRIGPIDSVGRYMMLGAVTLHGSKTVLTGSLTVGVELGHVPEFFPGIAAFLGYYASPDFSISSPTDTRMIQTGALILGASLTIYFE